jgi:beta-xylosidase
MQTTLPHPAKPARLNAHGANSNYTYPWLPDQGDGTYCNPIIYADYSDPDAIRVGDNFYLTASSFNCTPGLPILHSKDLVNWTLIGHALKNLPHPRYAEVQPGCGVWAPAFRFHAGKFWIFFPTPDEGIYVVTADHPAGQWSEPHLVQAGKGLIDPCPLWDDDGRAYLVHAYAKSRSGIRHILRVRPMAPDGSKLLGEGEVVFHKPRKHPTLEGPKFLKKDGWYYILAPAGGVETGWQVALRSKSIYGPYQDKIVLAQGDTDINGPHQGALVDTPDDGWWFVHFQDAALYGRIVHLQPVIWKDGWPLMGKNAEPVRRHPKPIFCSEKPCAPQTSDSFDDPKLGLQWQWHANHRDDWYSLATRPGWLRLYPQLAAASSSQQPNLLLQKFPARSFSVETVLELVPMQSGEEAGLVITGKTQARLGVQHNGTKNRIVLRTGGDKERVLAETTAQAVALRVKIQDGGRCTFAFAEDGALVSTPGTFKAQKGMWIGSKVGLYSVKPLDYTPAGHVDFDYFRFE